jgi:hypothetical protein
MQGNESRVEEELEPIWVGVLAGVSALYGLWPVISLHQTLIVKGGGGVGWFLLAFGGLFAFCIVMGITSQALSRFMLAFEDWTARAAICLAMVVVFVVARGVPPLIGLIVVALAFVICYYHGRRAYEDANDRREFLDE